mmetsp:Transcript_42284/g.97886  ORF Transcript_42284/g.97886 Transcript_42284/m.97886 type:complete len:496 (-) Transcript_42284:532-2019(-)
MFREFPLLRREHAQAHRLVGMVEQEVQPSIHTGAIFQRAICTDHGHDVVRRGQPTQRKNLQDIDGVFNTEKICQVAVRVHPPAASLLSFKATTVKSNLDVLFVPPEQGIGGQDTKQRLVKELFPVGTANRGLRSRRGGLPLQVEVRLPKPERSGTHVNPNQLQLVDNGAGLAVVARVPVHIRLHVPHNALVGFHVLHTRPQHVDKPVLAEERIGHVQSEHEAPVAKLWRDLGPPSHARECVIPDGVFDGVVPVGVRGHVVAREANGARELRGEVKHRCKAVHGSKQVYPGGHRAIDAPWSAHHIDTFAGREALEEFGAHVGDGGGHNNVVEGASGNGAVILATYRVSCADGDLPPVDLLNVEANVRCLLEHVVDDHLLSIRRMCEVHVHLHVLELERVAPILQLPLPTGRKLVAEDVLHPLEAHERVRLHKLYNDRLPSPVQGSQEPEEGALVIDFGAHVGEHQNALAGCKGSPHGFCRRQRRHERLGGTPLWTR